jgi:hypothetical protein
MARLSHDQGADVDAQKLLEQFQVACTTAGTGVSALSVFRAEQTVHTPM